jgi:DNA polymerase-3 subunit gamma/tau
MSKRKKKEGPVSESISHAPVTPPTPAKLVIESEPPIPAEIAAPQPPSPVSTQEVQPKTQVAGKPASTSIGKLSGLTNIRKEVALQQQQKVVKESVALSAEALQACWNEYIQYLRSIKNPAYASFELAQLEVLDAQSFQVFTGNALQLKYIEHERLALLDILQKKFHNRNIQVKLVMDPSRFPTVEVPVELSARDQFVLLTQKFPLVLELQQRLKLELD